VVLLAIGLTGEAGREANLGVSAQPVVTQTSQETPACVTRPIGTLRVGDRVRVELPEHALNAALGFSAALGAPDGRPDAARPRS